MQPRPTYKQRILILSQVVRGSRSSILSELAGVLAASPTKLDKSCVRLSYFRFILFTIHDFRICPSVTAPTLVLVPRTKYRPASARTAGRTRHFAPAPLHFTPASVVASAARTSASVPFRSVGRKPSRPAKTAARPSDSGIQRPRCSAYRPSSNNREHGQLSLAPQAALPKHGRTH